MPSLSSVNTPSQKNKFFDIANLKDKKNICVASGAVFSLFLACIAYQAQTSGVKTPFFKSPSISSNREKEPLTPASSPSNLEGILADLKALHKNMQDNGPQFFKLTLDLREKLIEKLSILEETQKTASDSQDFQVLFTVYQYLKLCSKGFDFTLLTKQKNFIIKEDKAEIEKLKKQLLDLSQKPAFSYLSIFQHIPQPVYLLSSIEKSEAEAIFSVDTKLQKLKEASYPQAKDLFNEIENDLKAIKSNDFTIKNLKREANFYLYYFFSSALVDPAKNPTGVDPELIPTSYGRINDFIQSSNALSPLIEEYKGSLNALKEKLLTCMNKNKS